MSFAIMRCAKLKSFGSFGGAIQHCFRERPTPNSDENLRANNEHYYAKNEAESFKKLRELLPEKVRKNGVICVEYVFTASPEWFDQVNEEKKKEFFNRSVAWIKAKYGEENIVVATVHNDEKTPHLSAFVCPITKDGRLCARDFIGGREKLQKDQDSFAEAVKDLGLERGLRGSKAKHMTIQQYYGSLAKASEVQKITAEELAPQGGFLHKEKPEEVAERLNQRLEQSTRPIRSKAAEYEREKQRRLTTENRLQQAEKALKQQQDQNAEMLQKNNTLQEFKNQFDILTPEDMREIQQKIQERQTEKQQQELQQQMQKSMAESWSKLGKAAAFIEQMSKKQTQQQSQKQQKINYPRKSKGPER